MYSAAASPAMSPTTPPPNATTKELRCRCAASMPSRTEKRVVLFLCRSPAGTTQTGAPAKADAIASEYRRATLESVTTKTSCPARKREASSNAPAPHRTAEGRDFVFTGMVCMKSLLTQGKSS